MAKTKEMTFGEALEIVKNGGRCARTHWNGKGQYIELATDISYQNSGCRCTPFHETSGNAAIVFVGKSGTQVGWLASQADMLSNDWYVIPEGHLECTSDRPPFDQKSDMIHRPNHYTWRGGMECVDIADELCRGQDGIKAYLIGCAAKYIYRYPKKNGLQDLDKAIECLKMLRNRETREASAAK